MRRCVFFLIISSSAFAQSEGADFFESKIRPLLAANCYACHNSKSPTAALALDSKTSTLRVIVPGKPDESRLLDAIRQTGSLRMPPGKKLPQSDIDAVAEWIKMGAPDPRAADAPRPLSAYDWNKAREHWSFRPVQDPPVPHAASPEWRAPIDAFLKAKLDEQHLAPQPRAPKLALIRRVTYDLTGLPPTPEEVDAFLKDNSPKAYEKLVDRLLASQQYGEKWGRHWLDVVRYADTAGDNADFPVPSMFRYRNWVIAAFNRDMPYNEFLRDQLAGDILANRSDIEDYQQKTIATGYLANSRRFGSRAPVQEFHLTIDDTIDKLGKGILGLSVGCARCHDHKFDPIPTADYYGLFGILKSTAYPHPGTEIYPHTFGFAALNPAQSEELKHWEQDLSGLDFRIEDMKAGRIKFATPEEKKKAEQENRERLRKLHADYPYLAKAYAVAEGKPEDARIMVRGEPKDLGPSVPRHFLTILGGQTVPPDENGSGRRELADWITDPKNPLTARVIVNRVWGWHFGRGIVATPDDFGARGEAPTHPELLDWLTTRFVESGWSIKKLNRQIVLSRAYQSASGDNPANELKDSKNAYLWRFPRRRLDAEEIRDSLLFVSGNLDPAPGGEHPFTKEVTWRYTQHTPFVAKEDDFATNKRSIYLMQQRIRRQSFLDLFDGADPNAETGVRPLTTTALQALYDMNDPFFHKQAESLAARVTAAANSDPDRLKAAFRILYGRVPEKDEVRDMSKFLAESQPADQAWPALMRVLLASNEFLTLD
jgi:hypothetical protein